LKSLKSGKKKIMDSTNDRRIENNPPQESKTYGDPMRLQYRILSDAEKAAMGSLKLEFEALYLRLAVMGTSREMSIAKTYLEESCMWAVKHITRG
jgi:hypothetical protein